jgi:hypothetical protein
VFDWKAKSQLALMSGATNHCQPTNPRKKVFSNGTGSVRRVH